MIQGSAPKCCRPEIQSKHLKNSFNMINLLNFPHNVEDMIHEDESGSIEQLSTGDWIRKILSQKNISHEALAKNLKIAPKDLQKLETDTSLPPDEWFEKFKDLSE